MRAHVYCDVVRKPIIHAVRRSSIRSVRSSFRSFWLDVLKGWFTRSPDQPITNQFRHEYMPFPGISYHGKYSEKTECVKTFVEGYRSLVENLLVFVEKICVIQIAVVVSHQASQPNDVTMTNQYV